MADSKASEAARELLRHRWGNQVAVRAAQLVIERASELPPDLAAELSAAVSRPGPGDVHCSGAARLGPAEPGDAA